MVPVLLLGAGRRMDRRSIGDYESPMGRLLYKDIGGIRLAGFSLAGEETVVAAPEYNVCFDVGRAPREVVSIDNVCLTHGHMDHAAGIAYYFSQRAFLGNSPGRIIAHRILAPAIQRLMDVWAEIEGHPSPTQIQGVEPLEDVVIRRGLVVRPFSVRHSGSSLGYCLIEVRHKLKAEFVGKSGPQLVALKRQGVAIENRVEVPVLTYTGDTALGRWLDLDFIRRSPVVLLDCTFYEPAHVERARAGKHIHADDVPRVLDALPESMIVLIHVTRRTDLRVAKRIVERIVPRRDAPRVSFFMDRPLRGGRNRSARRPDDETVSPVNSSTPVSG